MSETFTLPKRDDNSSVDAEKLVKWAHQFDGVDAHIVYDYITLPTGEGVRGAFNGVTLQWDHDGDGVADGAVHVPAGGTVTRLDKGFAVEFTRTLLLPAPGAPQGAPLVAVTSAISRTVDGDDVRVVSE